jgi:hypothetical protein
LPLSLSSKPMTDSSSFLPRATREGSAHSGAGH